MEINVNKLTREERQDIYEKLHALGVRPQQVEPVRELLDAKNAHIADLQQVISMESANVHKFFQLVGIRSGAIQPATSSAEEPPPDDGEDPDPDEAQEQEYASHETGDTDE